MKLFYDLAVLSIKTLIAIGDAVILIPIKIYKFFEKIYAESSFWLKKTKKSFRKHLLILKRSLTLTPPKLKLPKLKLPKTWVKIPVLRIKRRATEVEIFKAPTYRVPRFSMPSFSSLPFPKLPQVSFRKRHRGRPRKPLKIPPLPRLKYFILGTLFTFFFVFLPLLMYIFIQSLPNPRELVSQDIAQSTKIYDRGGTLLYQLFANQNRTLIPLTEIPKDLINATIAIEDKNFYSSTLGFDPLAIVRSLIADLSGKPLQGGSTITQQLIKSRLLTPEQSLDRKIKEVVLAFWAQRIYTQDQILEMYFNQVPYGGTSWGVEAAAQTYFGKKASELTLAQSSFLAGLPQAPSAYSPYTSGSNAWRERQIDVLSKMVSLSFITRDEAKAAQREDLIFEPVQHVLHAPHFVMFVREQLVEKYGLPLVERGGLTVITSLDLSKQELAQETVKREVYKSGHLNVHNGAALITNPKNGDILAMVGGRDYYDPDGGNFNVTTALRQPGSTIKVVTYSAALLNGYTAATPIIDAPVAFASAGSPPYTPVNYDGRFHGTLTLRSALGNSVNVPAVKTLNTIGVDKMVGLAKEMGITTWKDPSNYGLAITLGAAEVKMTDLATVYGTLANQGKRVDLNPILKITDYQGNVLEEKSKIREFEILPRSIAFIISNILSDNTARAMAFGPSSTLLIPGHTVSVKTGTSDNKRDNWTVGFTPSYLTAVWVGNNDNAPLNPTLASGITGAAPIWHDIMTNILKDSGRDSENYTIPEDIVTKPCFGRNEYFVKGTENSVSCRFIPSPSPKPSASAASN